MVSLDLKEDPEVGSEMNAASDWYQLVGIVPEHTETFYFCWSRGRRSKRDFFVTIPERGYVTIPFRR